MASDVLLSVGLDLTQLKKQLGTVKNIINSSFKQQKGGILGISSQETAKASAQLNQALQKSIFATGC